jgi:hypothetical protein
MSRVTTIITGPDGSVTRIVTRRSGCGGGCLTFLAAVVVLFGPAAWFPLPLAVLAYVALGVIAVSAATAWVLQTMRTARSSPRPPVSTPPPPASQ